MDEMLDELIELDSCTMDLADGTDKPDELKYLQEKTTFEYLPEWCHVLTPSFEHRAYLHVVSNDLKAEEESKKEKKRRRIMVEVVVVERN
uniref:Uncharacterized protein n=1 Tax=Caenorhabditis japonica TaxID=281687 RepID=A0A8R1ITJ0_CAEJA